MAVNHGRKGRFIPPGRETVQKLPIAHGPQPGTGRQPLDMQQESAERLGHVLNLSDFGLSSIVPGRAANAPKYFVGYHSDGDKEDVVASPARRRIVQDRTDGSFGHESVGGTSFVSFAH